MGIGDVVFLLKDFRDSDGHHAGLQLQTWDAELQGWIKAVLITILASQWILLDLATFSRFKLLLAGLNSSLLLMAYDGAKTNTEK